MKFCVQNSNEKGQVWMEWLQCYTQFYAK